MEGSRVRVEERLETGWQAEWISGARTSADTGNSADCRRQPYAWHCDHAGDRQWERRIVRQHSYNLVAYRRRVSAFDGVKEMSKAVPIPKPAMVIEPPLYGGWGAPAVPVPPEIRCAPGFVLNNGACGHPYGDDAVAGKPASPAANGTPAAKSSSGFDLSSLFSGGNNTLLLIGLAVAAWMMFGKKK